MKRLRYGIEAFFSLVAYLLLRILPLDAASALGGMIARNLGPRTRVHRVARINLSTAMPELSESDQSKILQEMWDNLGRVFGEYAHLPTRIMTQRIHLARGQEHLTSARESGKPILLISGHLGNWETMPLASYLHFMPLHLLYRQANNPVVDCLIGQIRRRYSRGLYAKGSAGARAVIKAMKAREPVAMLVDQKTNDGIAVPFFGQDAMTTTVVAKMMLKYEALILPCHCVRTHGAHFEMRVDAPIDYSPTGDEATDIHAITRTINTRMEHWIREQPGQWFWVHKRWPFSKKR